MEATSQPEAEEEVAAAAAAAEEEEEEEKEKGEKIRKKYIKKEEERKKRPLPHSPPVSTQWTISTNGPVRMRSRRDAHPATRCFLLLPPLPSLPPSISIFFFFFIISLFFLCCIPDDRKTGRPEDQGGGPDAVELNWTASARSFPSTSPALPRWRALIGHGISSSGRISGRISARIPKWMEIIQSINTNNFFFLQMIIINGKILWEHLWAGARESRNSAG